MDAATLNQPVWVWLVALAVGAVPSLLKWGVGQVWNAREREQARLAKALEAGFARVDEKLETLFERLADQEVRLRMGAGTFEAFREELRRQAAVQQRQDEELRELRQKLEAS